MVGVEGVKSVLVSEEVNSLKKYLDSVRDLSV